MCKSKFDRLTPSARRLLDALICAQARDARRAAGEQGRQTPGSRAQKGIPSYGHRCDQRRDHYGDLFDHSDQETRGDHCSAGDVRRRSYYQLEWLGANVCFLGGLFGFVGLLGIRAYLAFGPAFGRFGALLCGAVVTHGCSVVNAGIAAGDGSGVRHASNYLGLVARYVTLVVANAWRTRGPLRILSLLCVVGAAWTASAAARTEHGDDCPLAK